MTRLEKYTKQHAETVEAQQVILAEAEKQELGALTPEQDKLFKDLDTKRKTLKASMQRESDLEEAERYAPAARVYDPAKADAPPVVRGGAPAGLFPTLGDQLRAIVNAGCGIGVDPRLSHINTLSAAATGGSANVGSEGGFLIQKDFAPDLMKEGFVTGELSRRCSPHEVSAQSDGLEVPYIDETSRATGSRWGGVRIYRRAEAETVTASKPKLGKWRCDLEDLMGIAYLTDRLSQDGPAMEGVFREAFREEFGFVIDDEIYRGNGTGQCLGVLNAGALVTVTKETGQLADTIVAENIIKIWARVLPRSKARGAWFINTECTTELQKMQIGTGTSGQLVYMPPGGLSQAPHGTIYGRPVIEIEQASALGDAGDIAYLDLTQYKLISKGGVQEAESIHVRFLQAEKALRWISRVNGAPKLQSALTPYKGASTLSPFVTLGARA